MIIKKNIRLIYIASIISIGILVMFGILYLEKSRDQIKYIDAVERTYHVLSAINFCEKELIEAEAAQRGYLLTAQTDQKLRFESTLPLIDSSLREIGKLTADNFSQKIFFIQLKKFVAARVEILKKNLMQQVGDPHYVEKLRQGSYVMDNCRIYMAKMRSVEESLLRERLKTKNRYQRLNLSYFKGTFITACVICLIALGIFFRELGIRLTTQKNLKTKISELSNRKQELEEIAFAASHDLQEPMRKVRIFSTLLIKKLTLKMPETDLEVIHRINRNTEQMHGRLNDLVLYINLLNPNEKFTGVDLNEVFKDAYGKVFPDENVQIQIQGDLPIIRGSKSQLETLLIHIFDNASKFKDPYRELTLTIKCERKRIKEAGVFWENLYPKELHEVTITDNGIGFDHQYNDKVFGLFQRLHTQIEYPGKGIGLAIARRIMSNHKGYIISKGERLVGASFILYFPIFTAKD